MRTRFLASLGIVGVLLLAGVGAANAHTELSEGRPGAGQEVGGEIDKIELEFRGAIDDAEIRVFEPEGEEITGADHTEVSGVIATQQIETITEPGQYQVTYSVLSVDGDLQNGAYVFTYDPDAPPLPDDDDGSGSTLLLWGFVAVSVVVLGYGFSKLRSGSAKGEPSDE
jgi:methionine-rich copper-binding protein CopC